MRIRKVATIVISLVVVLGAAVVYYYAVVYPQNWYSRTQGDCVRILSGAQTTNDLQRPDVLSWGAFIALTNGSWIAIRYCDSHSGGLFSCAVARDSAGGWFESDRHFCGMLSGFWAELKTRQGLSAEEMRATGIEPWTNVVTVARTNSWGVPTIEELIPLALAPNLQSARQEMAKIGFTELRR